jgi:hypothetical protein
MSVQDFGIAMKGRIKLIAVCAVSIAASVMVIAGCTVATNDSTTQSGPLKLELPSEACLKKAIPVIQNYFEGSANEADVNTSWACISGALSTFTTSTRGANPEFYTSRELRTFLQTFYLGDIKISDQLLTEAMRVKQLLLGGADDRLTRPELAQAQNTIQALRLETLRMLPYVKYLFQSATVDEAMKNPADVEAGIAAMQKSISAIGALLNRSPESYSTYDLQSLFEELKPIFNGWVGPAKALSYLPTFEVAKALVLNPPGNRVAPVEWQPLFVNAGRAYGLYLRWHYLVANQDLLSGVGLAQMTAGFEELVEVLKSGIDAKPSKVIAYAQIDATIDELIRLDFVDERLEDTTLKSVVRTAFSKFFNPGSSGARPKVTGLNSNVLNQLYTFGTSFFEMQRLYGNVTAKAVAADPTLSGKPIPWKTFLTLFSSESTPYSAAQDDLKKLMTLASPVSFRDNGTVIFDNRLTYLPMSLQGFTRYNWESAATRALIQGYATDANSNRWTGVTQDQVHVFFNDVHALGTDLEILEPKDDTLWKSSFVESNMFMVSAVNDDHMSYYEVFDYLAYLLGAGTMGDRMYSDAKDSCAHVGVDGFNRPTMDISCFRARYGQKFATIHAELPWWVKMQSDRGAAGWPAIEQGLETAARTHAYSDDPISTSDLTRMTMVMQYIESLYVRFDVNRDGLIDYNEAQKALPLFKDLLVQASGFKTDKQINALFMYILDKGKPPTSILDKVYFQVIWLNSQATWKKVTADRFKLLGVIGALKSLTK